MVKFNENSVLNSVKNLKEDIDYVHNVIKESMYDEFKEKFGFHVTVTKETCEDIDNMFGDLVMKIYEVQKKVAETLWKNMQEITDDVSELSELYKSVEVK